MTTPILDNHLHLDPVHGRGLDAVKEFARSGGTHVLVVNKPSWHVSDEYGTETGFRDTFDITVQVTRHATEILAGRAWPVLGVHPGLVSKLVDDGHDVDAATAVMVRGLEIAAEYDEPVALKSGRPHYDVPDDVWDASNRVMTRAFELAAETGVAVQLHTESSEDLTDVTERAEAVGLPGTRVVKHYAGGALAGPVKSVIAQKPELERAVKCDEPFLMETDFIDDPDRPGAVLGPRTVPRRVDWLLESGHDDAVRRAHVDTPATVYGIDTVGTLGKKGL